MPRDAGEDEDRRGQKQAEEASHVQTPAPYTKDPLTPHQTRSRPPKPIREFSVKAT